MEKTMKQRVSAVALAAVVAIATLPGQEAFATQGEDALVEIQASEAAIEADDTTGELWADGRDAVDVPGNQADVLRDTSNQSFRFNFAFVGATQGTEGRKKDNDSSAYLWVTDKTIPSCFVYIDGSYYQNSGYENRTINRSTGEAGGTATVSTVGEFQIYNNVYETGRKYAKFTGWSAGYTGNMNGAWSPDCVLLWNYPVINNY